MDIPKSENEELNFLSKEEIQQLYESVAEGAKPIMLAKDVCKCGGWGQDCSCNGNVGTMGCC